MLHIFWVRGRAIGKGIDFPDIGITNGINFHNFGMRNGTDFQDFGMKYKVRYTFSKNWYSLYSWKSFCGMTITVRIRLNGAKLRRKSSV